EYRPHAIRLDRRTVLVTRAAKEFESLQVIVQALAIVAGLQGCFCEIVQRFSDLTRNIGLLPELQRSLIIGKRIAGQSSGEIDIPDIVQAESLDVLIAYIPLDLQGFFEGL